MSYHQLIRKKLLGKLNPEEELQFQKWLSQAVENQQLYDRLLDLHLEGVSIPQFTDRDTSAIWERLLHKAQQQRVKKQHRRKQGYRVAAVISVMVGILWGYLQWPSTENVQQLPSDSIVLELANGRFYDLSKPNTDIVLDEIGVALGTSKEGKLIYSEDYTNRTGVDHTIHVPNGKQFELQLSDGTYIHLNAGSSVRYASDLGELSVRKVFLVGEAYFDVATDSLRPFIVTNGAVDIEVLGTQFNVSGYDEDTEVNTVLVEGAIRLSKKGSEKTSHILAPGQKAAWDKKKMNISLMEVDVNKHISWREGKLVFRKVDFNTIMKKLQRKYAVSIENRYAALGSRIFSATFEEESIREVLETFAEETYFEYRVENKKIIIEKPQEHLKMDAYD